MKSPLEELVKRLLYEGTMRECVIETESRGGDKRINGEDVTGLEDRFMTTAEAAFPLHRIKTIRKGDEILWKR